MRKYLLEALVLVVVEQTLRYVRPDYLPTAWFLILGVITSEIIWSQRNRIGLHTSGWGRRKLMWSYVAVAAIGAVWLCSYWFAVHRAYRVLIPTPSHNENTEQPTKQTQHASANLSSQHPAADTPTVRAPEGPTAASATRRQHGARTEFPVPVVIPPGTKIEATTNAPGSAAVGINTGTVTVNPPINPNAPTITYDCAGNKRTAGASPSAALSINLEVGAKRDVLTKMIALNNSHTYPGLLNVCKEEMSSTPEWLTPYLFCGLAYLGMQDGKNAQDMLDQYDRKKGPGYDAEPCNQIREHLKTQLTIKPRS